MDSLIFMKRRILIVILSSNLPKLINIGKRVPEASKCLLENISLYLQCLAMQVGSITLLSKSTGLGYLMVDGSALSILDFL
jgi:hypothetical protein